MKKSSLAIARKRSSGVTVRKRSSQDIARKRKRKKSSVAVWMTAPGSMLTVRAASGTGTTPSMGIVAYGVKAPLRLAAFAEARLTLLVTRTRSVRTTAPGSTTTVMAATGTLTAVEAMAPHVVGMVTAPLMLAAPVVEAILTAVLVTRHRIPPPMKVTSARMTWIMLISSATDATITATLPTSGPVVSMKALSKPVALAEATLPPLLTRWTGITTRTTGLTLTTPTMTTILMKVVLARTT